MLVIMKTCIKQMIYFQMMIEMLEKVRKMNRLKWSMEKKKRIWKMKEKKEKMKKVMKINKGKQ